MALSVLCSLLAAFVAVGGASDVAEALPSLPSSRSSFSPENATEESLPSSRSSFWTWAKCKSSCRAYCLHYDRSEWLMSYQSPGRANCICGTSASIKSTGCIKDYECRASENCNMDLEKCVFLYNRFSPPHNEYSKCNQYKSGALNVSSPENAEELPLDKGANAAEELPLEKAANAAEELPLDKAANAAEELPLDKAANAAEELPLDKAANAAEELPLDKAANAAEELPLDKAANAEDKTSCNSNDFCARVCGRKGFKKFIVSYNSRNGWRECYCGSKSRTFTNSQCTQSTYCQSRYGSGTYCTLSRCIRLYDSKYAGTTCAKSARSTDLTNDTNILFP